MVDVLTNSLLRNRETTEELGSSGTDRALEMPEGEESWRAFYEHPLTAATSAMLNIGGSPMNNEDSSSTASLTAANAVSLLCEYYKLPIDRLDKAIIDKYASLPDFWTALAGNNQVTSVIGNSASSLGSSVPVSLLSQATGLVRHRRYSNQVEVNQQEGDLYLNRGIIKREISITEELIVPTSNSSDILKSCTKDDTCTDCPISPLPVIVQVKQEEDSPSSPALSPILSSPQAAKVVELSSAVLAQAYSSHGYESLAAQYTNSQYQGQPAVYMVATPPEYKLPDYYAEQIRGTGTNADSADTITLFDQYLRQTASLKGGLAVDLPSPDSGIEETATPRETCLTQIYEYSEASQGSTETLPNKPSGSSRRSWHDYGRLAELDRVQIPKIHSDVGFRYFLDSPISTSQRRVDDRITYINKGQFYGITLEYIPESSKPLKSTTVKSVVMLSFREEKPHEEELKAWQFWHSRQHSVKQRILDADTKNSLGIVGQIDEVTHNAVAFYWNPLEAPAKVNLAVQCLSTDFSNQKGVKGLPLHLQIDTYDDFRENSLPHHRGYCQIKVFCDKGAERKTRDEERRAAKRKLIASNCTEGSVPTFSGRKKLDDMFHLPCERSEFYSMSDLSKPPILFTPTGDVDQITSIDLSFYTSQCPMTEDHTVSSIDCKDTESRGSSVYTPSPKRIKLYPGDRVLIYARQESEEAFQPLHVQPLTLEGLAKGIEKKYNISSSNIRHIFKRMKKGITIQVDDPIVKHYCNEDTCLIEVTKVDDDLCDLTLVEL